METWLGAVCSVSSAARQVAGEASERRCSARRTFRVRTRASPAAVSASPRVPVARDESRCAPPPLARLLWSSSCGAARVCWWLVRRSGVCYFTRRRATRREEMVFVDLPLRSVQRELHTRGYLYLVHDKFTGTTLVAQTLRLVAERMSAGASRDETVSASQLYEHAAGRVSGLVKHRFNVERLHLDDADLVGKVEAVRGAGRTDFLGGLFAYTFGPAARISTPVDQHADVGR